MLDAALSLVAEGGPAAATMGALAQHVGAPVGSIYHRFASRELLFARVWLRAVQRFQHGFLAALDQPDLDAAAADAALHVVEWSREHTDEAALLLLHRRQDLAARWPTELGEDLAAVSQKAEAALERYTRRRYGEVAPPLLRRVTFALVDVPYAAVRRHLLAHEPPPSSVDVLVADAVRCLLGARKA